MYSVKRPWRSAEVNFRFEVPWNMPCSATIKAEVMRIFDGTGNAGVQKMTNPHLFLLNYELGWNEWFSLGDEDCLDELPEAFDPYEVYVIDQKQCQCGTCDLAWMLDGWYCPRIWYRTLHADGRCRSANALALLELQTRGAAHSHGRCRSANAPSSSSSDGDAA